MFELEPIEKLVWASEVHAYFHHGFRQAMDTLRDERHLEDLLSWGGAPWRKW
jgi:glucose-1-phosphate cytidylyltransferase